MVHSAARRLLVASFDLKFIHYNLHAFTVEVRASRALTPSGLYIVNALRPADRRSRGQSTNKFRLRPPTADLLVACILLSTGKDNVVPGAPARKGRRRRLKPGAKDNLPDATLHSIPHFRTSALSHLSSDPIVVWYIIPTGALRGEGQIYLSPHRPRTRARYERFRDAWHLLRPDPVPVEENQLAKQAQELSPRRKP